MRAPAFDLQPLREAVSGDVEIISEIISVFIRSSREDLRLIRDALDRADGAAVRAAAHHLKGSLLELGAQDAVALTRQLEDLGSCYELSRADKVLQELDAAIRDLVSALNETEFRATV